MSWGPYILWIDEAEWYILCLDCKQKNLESEWSGSTKVSNWSRHSKEVDQYAKTVEKCEFCKSPFDWFIGLSDAMFWLFD